MSTNVREAKHYTRLSFWYPISFLVPASLILVFVPQFLLTHFSSEMYSLPAMRLAGAAMSAFTILVLNIFFLRVEPLYNAVIYVRLPVLAIVAWIYATTRNPLFLTLFVMVVPGEVLSFFAYLADRRQAARPLA